MVMGGTMGVVIDVAAHGLTFGVFTALGGLLGAGSALMGAKKIAKGPGIIPGGDRFQVGPNENLQFLYVLMDRVLIYYAHIIHRAHGRRDMADPDRNKKVTGSKMGISAGLSPRQRNICARFFKSVSGRTVIKGKKAIPEFALLVESLLDKIADKEI